MLLTNWNNIISTGAWRLCQRLLKTLVRVDFDFGVLVTTVIKKNENYPHPAKRETVVERAVTMT